VSRVGVSRRRAVPSQWALLLAADILFICISMLDKCGQARSRKKIYTHRHDPLSYPNSDLICGSPDCENPAHIWLPHEEAYPEGAFRLHR